ncbi:alpha/beta hydrolase [Nocardioides sp. P5_C9_2]
MATRILAGAALALGAALLAAPVASAGPGTVGPAPVTTQVVTESPAFVAPPIDWGRCADGFLRSAGARCGMLTVPLDHADPTGPTIELAVSRVRHRGSRDRGVLFTNPGGPGGSGTFLAAWGQYLPGRIARTYDWMGMDPRGVGESSPALTCDRTINKIGTRPPYDPTSAAILDAWVTRSEAYAAACGTSAAAPLLPHMKTTDIVADFEVLRDTLGADRVSFYGLSYGTYIAQVYATLHPDRLDKLVLDGVVDPRGVWYDANAAQNVAFERSMAGFWRWAARGHADLRLGRTAAAVERTYYRVLHRLTRRPVDGVGAAELSDVALGAGYATFLWPEVADALSEIVTDGTARLARRSYTSLNPTTAGGDNSYAAYLATTCTDAPWPTDLAVLLGDNERQDRRHPFLTWPNGWFNAPCRTWPAPPAAAAVEVATSTRSALLINETYDGATPIEGALEVRRRFTGAVLIEGVGGTTHAGSLSGVACVDHPIAFYLATGVLPRRRSGDRADVRCDPVPAPPVG